MALGATLSVLLGASEGEQRRQELDGTVQAALRQAAVDLPQELEQLELLLAVSGRGRRPSERPIDVSRLFPSVRSLFAVPATAGGEPALDRATVMYPPSAPTVPLLSVPAGRDAARATLVAARRAGRTRLSPAVVAPGESVRLMLAAPWAQGWSALTLPADAFLSQAFARSARGIALEIAEGRRTIAMFSPSGPVAEREFEDAATASVDMAGRSWTLRAVATGRPSWIDWRTLLAGLLVTAFVVTLLATARLAEARARRIAADTTAGLKRRTRELQTLTDNSRELIARFDAERRLVFANPAMIEMARFPPAWQGARMSELPVPAVMAGAYEEHVKRSLDSGQGRRTDLVLRSPTGASRDFEAEFVVERDGADGEVSGVLTVARDVTERKHAERDLARRAFEDALTGLANRALVFDRVTQALAGRDAGHVAVFALDLDRFKLVNDSFGHHVGDAVLLEVAERLRRLVRGDDTVGRLGGDELIVIARVPAPLDAVHLAERIVAALRPPMTAMEHELVVTASVGLTYSTEDPSSADQLLREADAAMYRAKADGGNGFAVFDETMSADALERLTLEAAIREGVTRDEFLVHLQPLVAGADARPVGFEALVRWQRPGHGLVAPGTFIAVAEQSALIVEIGSRVLRLALQQARAWRFAEHGLRVWVNVSVRQVVRPGFVADVVTALADAGAGASVLGLEVTETVLAQDSRGVRSTLVALRDRGVAIAVDDFGQGYSSLGRLRELPIDSIKIDRAFVDGVPGSSHDLAIVGAIVSVARALGARTVAEGVETAEQAEALRAAGCDVLQGYLFGAPSAPEELGTWLTSPPAGVPR